MSNLLHIPDIILKLSKDVMVEEMKMPMSEHACFNTASIIAQDRSQGSHIEENDWSVIKLSCT